MQKMMDCSYAFAAESPDSVSYDMSAASDSYFAKTLRAIMIMMAFVLFTSAFFIRVPAILIAIIWGVITLVIVRGNARL